ncbi:uncharacterized protein LOC141641295 [Silene latifolia]|uniref:uncharacterized protein LOC141641295 n=1 Tax=Silene latifolia TaxID=37657 RepID=UPI003D77E30C
MNEAINKDVKAGVFVPKGREDILAKALGKAEHPGRVRGVPNGIGIKELFGKAPKNPTPTQLKEKISTLEEQLKETQLMMLKFWQTGERPSEEVLARFMDAITKSTQGNGASMEAAQSQAREEPSSGDESGEESPDDEPSHTEKSVQPSTKEPLSNEVFRTPVATIPKIPISPLEDWQGLEKLYIIIAGETDSGFRVGVHVT